ncbi:MAG: hypothetical protein Fur0015_06360 [Ignavibacteriales bacterium]
MLGNYYFLIQQYSEAAEEYEKCIKGKNVNPFIKKKFILSLIKQEKFQEAIHSYYRIITKKDLSIYISSPKSDQIVCRELIEEFTKNTTFLPPEEKHRILGIIWSFCDSQKSKEHFNLFRKEHKSNRNTITKITTNKKE